MQRYTAAPWPYPTAHQWRNRHIIEAINAMGRRGF